MSGDVVESSQLPAMLVGMNLFGEFWVNRLARDFRAGGADGAFTLVELLVVISVIALLAAILVPSLYHAREYSYAAVCRSNLGQLFRTLHAGESLEIPSASGWVSFAQGKGAGGVLCCPKDDLDDSGDTAFGTTGAVRQIDPPASEVFDSLESNTYVFAWRERTSFTLPASVKVNLSRPGRYVSASEYSTATISAGTVVDCYFLHFDPVGDGPAEASGQLSFGGEIIGVICLEGDLLAADPVFGIPQTQYDPGHWGARGFEGGQDIVVLSKDMQTLTLEYFYSTFPGEDVRILTRPGHSASYGMNNQVRPLTSRTGQVLLAEYGKTIVDLDGNGFDDNYDEMIAPRHLGRANAVSMDGSVGGYRPEELAPATGRWAP